MRIRPLTVFIGCLLTFALWSAALPLHAEKKAAKALNSDTEKAVRRLRDNAAAGAGKADERRARNHYADAASAFTNALGEKSKKRSGDYKRPDRKFSPDKDLERVRKEIEDIRRDAVKRGQKGDLEGQRARFAVADALETGTRAYSVARIAEGLKRLREH